MSDLNTLLQRIQPADASARERAQARLDMLTKPPGSLGRLEHLVADLAAISGEGLPRVDPPAVLVFAADHGVAEEGVSAFPQAVTAQMVTNFANGGAAINVFARQVGARLEVIDVGVATPYEMRPGEDRGAVVVDRVRAGSGNIAREDAMTREQALAALMVGSRAVDRAREAGCRCLILGEMGIANTTSSSALLAAFTGVAPEQVVGRGTGIDDAGLKHKCDVIATALGRGTCADDALATLARLGGLEIAAMVGAFLAGAAARLPVLVDGFIATVAALTACRLCPAVRDYLIFGHLSQEAGHGHALSAVGGNPLLQLDLRLGEGSGAALAYPLLDAACRMLAEMATFDDAGVAKGDEEQEQAMVEATGSAAEKASLEQVNMEQVNMEQVNMERK
ncbi:nicotinate-nucleotide--dimethylbenzimidazole phosphoribosyltransferase [Halomonas binhaiensis]|uniref:Nicotinate-nucleotide--dimethylbenzimidazole phosphoribosyltransferase n=1 Tax=Halomonas binhaiensis TaxID=2562282 RepID=A0A5C1NGD3_9GAMM|nr:nicotinate-nucleotide--dimethylbenzimidazole phosphoribosyltransferase [Halomonas binhaiensis]QEM82306.1 nicotinate-nucleotide--dimethylbenzimidazole phosphoribosyltransferase [Halomonas binhaiensis]